MALLSGFSGQRAVQQWRDRIKILEEIGFIKTAPGQYGDFSFELILNPYKVVDKNKKNIKEGLYNSLLVRMTEIGAVDI